MKDELEHVENEGWHVRCGGTGSEFDGRLVSPDALVVPANSQNVTRHEVVASLRDGRPSVVATTTSTYVRVEGQWRLSLSTRTRVPDATTPV